jgi:CubicO group peptidase (beta-lactamase class C family)
MKNILNSILVALVISFQFSQQAKAQPSFIADSMDTYINRAMAQWQVPGLAVAVVKDGKVVVAKGYGVSNIETQQKVDELTLFQIASNTKAFTGTAISMLNFQKRLSLDTTVTAYLKDFKLYDECATQQATVRDLLCHRLGYATFQGDFLHWGSNLTRSELVYNFRNLKPEYKFRYHYGYTNMGFVTAGEIIKVVTDTTWDDYITAHFFKPLQMKHTNVSFNELTNDKNACKPYTLVDNKLTLLPYTNIDNIGACASINSCVSDMANWLLMQLDSGRFNGSTVVPWAALAETRNSQMIIGDVYSRMFPAKHFTTYGLGWQLYDYNGKKVCEHGGGANGFVTKTKFIPELGLGVIVYTNTDANSLYEALTTQIIDAYMQLPYRNYSDIYLNRYNTGVAQDSTELAGYRAIVAKKNKPEMRLKDFTGKYNNSFYGDLEIKEEKGQLNIYFSHHPDNIGQLQYMDGNKFLCTYTDVTCGVKVTPFTIEKNKVKSVTITVADFIDPFPYEFLKK